MTILKFLQKRRTESIESLEFFFFFQELFFELVNKHGKSNNSLILDFLRVLGGIYSWESRKVAGYMQALKDSVYWESREFYRKTMIQFVDGELNALEFARIFYDRLLNEKEIADNLVNDFKKQAIVELDPKSFQFSKIILHFELCLEAYQNQMEGFESENQVPEDDLLTTEDGLRKAVKSALEEMNRYFTD